ncbi:MAG: DUF4197 domain-containing protein [Candidatus Kapaibacterium sp.]
MKRIIRLSVMSSLMLLMGVCAPVRAQNWFDKAKKTLKEVTKVPVGGFTEADAAAALKEALVQGSSNGSAALSAVDGYFGNPTVKIPFPPDAQKIETTLRKVGLGKNVDEAVLSINRAAEKAAVEAKPIFVAAIEKMTITDAIAIVKGNDSAATAYLRRSTSPALTAAMLPVITKALESVKATQYWTSLMTSYNRIPFVDKINPDLPAYTTERALGGLFVMIAQEELRIRTNPVARTTELLKKVFSK